MILLAGYFSVTVLIGVVVGAATALLLLTIVACVCCSWCPLYTKKQPSKNRGGILGRFITNSMSFWI
jgi:hypothetical protein